MMAVGEPAGKIFQHVLKPFFWSVASFMIFMSILKQFASETRRAPIYFLIIILYMQICFYFYFATCTYIKLDSAQIHHFQFSLISETFVFKHENQPSTKCPNNYLHLTMYSPSNPPGLNKRLQNSRPTQCMYVNLPY